MFTITGIRLHTVLTRSSVLTHMCHTIVNVYITSRVSKPWITCTVVCIKLVYTLTMDTRITQTFVYIYKKHRKNYVPLLQKGLSAREVFPKWINRHAVFSSGESFQTE